MLGIERESYQRADDYNILSQGFRTAVSSRKGVFIEIESVNLNPLCGELGISFPSPCSFYPVLSPPEILNVLHTGSIPHTSSRTGRILKIKCLDLGKFASPRAIAKNSSGVA